MMRPKPGRLLIAALAGAILCASASVALADCYHNGRAVPEGTRIGGLVCQDGQWVAE